MIKLRHKDFCDGCEHLKILNTIGQHRQCMKYEWIKLPDEAVSIAHRGIGVIERPQKCKDENEAEIAK